jgi:translation initiation factor 3 subunit L
MAGSPSQRAHGVAPQGAIPGAIKSFLTYFQRYFRSNNVYEVRNYYKNGFRALSDAHYADRSWPEARAVAPLTDNDAQFLCLYKELYYRHIYSKLGKPSLSTRIASYKTYLDLFSMLSSDQLQDLTLPEEWLHDMVVEFVYQWQSFCQWRSKLDIQSGEESQMLRENPQVRLRRLFACLP